MANQRKEDDVFDDFVEKKSIETLQGISFDIFIKQIDFDDLHKNDEVIRCMVVISAIQG